MRRQVRIKAGRDPDPTMAIIASETTVRRWRARDTVQDRSHTSYRLATTLKPIQEFEVVELRKWLLQPLDDPRAERTLRA